MKLDMIRSTSSVPTIEMPPISSGIAAATTPRKTNSSSRARIGKAISSALVRSVRVWSLVSLKPGAKPPIATSSGLEATSGSTPSAAMPAVVLDVGGREVAGDRQRFAVAGDQLGAGAGVAQRVDDVADVLDLRHAAAEPVDLAAHRRAAQVERAAAGGADDQDDRRVRVVAEGVVGAGRSPARSPRRCR